jgi:hypothetical protein
MTQQKQHQHQCQCKKEQKCQEEQKCQCQKEQQQENSNTYPPNQTIKYDTNLCSPYERYAIREFEEYIVFNNIEDYDLYKIRIIYKNSNDSLVEYQADKNNKIFTVFFPSSK